MIGGARTGCTYEVAFPRENHHFADGVHHEWSGTHGISVRGGWCRFLLGFNAYAVLCRFVARSARRVNVTRVVCVMGASIRHVGMESWPLVSDTGEGEVSSTSLHEFGVHDTVARQILSV